MKFRTSGCMVCGQIATCRQAQLAGPADIAQGLTCDEWSRIDTPTLTARTEIVRELGTTGLTAIIDVSTTDIVYGEVEPMSDLATRKTELSGFARPQLKGILRELLSELEGKELKAALNTFDASVDWPSDDKEAKRLANKKAIRMQPADVTATILTLEFPDENEEPEEEKPARGRRTRKAKTEEPAEETKPRRTRRTRKSKAAEAEKEEEEEEPEAAEEPVNGGSADYAAFAKTLNAMAEALEEMPDTVKAAVAPIYEKLDTIETALIAMAHLDGLDEVTDLNSLIEMAGLGG